MNNFWQGFEKQAAIGTALLSGARNLAAGAIKGTRSLGGQAIAKGTAMAAGAPGATQTIGRGLQTAGNFIRKNPKTSMGIAGGAAALGATALGNKEK